MNWITVAQIGILMVLGGLLVNTVIDSIIDHYWKSRRKYEEDKKWHS